MFTVLLPLGGYPIVLFYVLFLCKCVLYYCQQVSTQLCCSMYCLCVNVYCTTATGCQPNCVLLCTVFMYFCTVLLPLGVYPIAVNKYIIHHHISYNICLWSTKLQYIIKFQCRGSRNVTIVTLTPHIHIIDMGLEPYQNPILQHKYMVSTSVHFLPP
jgi:hypothetical protein